MLNNIIETRGLVRAFGRTVAVRDLCLHVPAGCVYGFLGPNGAGKTTTIRMLLQLIRPDYGEISLFGQPFDHHNRGLLSKVGALVETPNLYSNLTGRENLEVTRRMLNLPRKNISRVLAIVDMEKDANRLVKGYSLGMRQRLGIALALLNDPVLLILDEPTNGLDPAGMRELRELISRLPQSHGITVLLSSHLLNEVEQISSHIGILNRGCMVFEGTLAKLQAERQHFLQVQVDRPEPAISMLRQEGWNVQLSDHSRLKVEVNGPSDAALLNQCLVSHNIPVFHLSVEELSLEDVFFSMTGQVEPSRKNLRPLSSLQPIAPR